MIARCPRCGRLPRPTLMGRTICDSCQIDVDQPPSPKVREQAAAALSSNERLSLMESLRHGGDWLGRARDYLQRRAIGGDRLTWGSLQDVRGLTVKDIEDLALSVAVAAILEDRVHCDRPPPETTDSRIGAALGCLNAAEVEGWNDALANGEIDRIRDLWARRISYARAALEGTYSPEKTT